MNRRLAIVLVTISCLVVPFASCEAVLYGADGAQGHSAKLYVLNPASGAIVSTVGSIGFAVTGLAVHPVTGVLYGSVGNMSAASPRSLITINKTTGAGTLVGSFGIAGNTMADLTFASDGTLYGWTEPSADALHTIDLTTGLATRVGTASFGSNTFGSGLAAGATSIFLAARGGTGVLSRVNRTTGQANPAAVLDWPIDGPIDAMTFAAGGVLLGIGLSPVAGDPAAFLLRIDPGTGHVTQLGRTVDFGDALAFDPPQFPADPPAPLPTLSEVGFAMMAALLGAVALRHVRRGARRPMRDAHT